MRLRVYLGLITTLIVPLIAGCASTPTADAPAADLYARVSRASVEVLVEGRLSGSGWFADPQGLIVTAGHVVLGKGDKLEIVTATGDRMAALIEARDLGHDLALLRVSPTAAAAPYPTLALADSMPPPGDDAFLFGAPQFRHGVLIRGTVGRPDLEYEYYGDDRFYAGIVHFTAPSPHGTSGGCWVDRAGRVVGNQSGLMLNNSAGNGLAFVAPLDAVRRLVATRTSAATPSIDAAIEELWEQSVKHIARFPRGAQGVIIANAHAGGPAAAAKLSRDTLIVAIDGSPVRLRRDLLSAVRSHQAGDPVTLTVIDADSHTRRDVQLMLISLEGRGTSQPKPAPGNATPDAPHAN